jgi:hypothetical protein
MTLSTNAKALEEKPIGLDDLRWKYRVILVSAHEPHMSNALANLNEFAAEIEERDIAWFVLGDDELHTNYKGKLIHTLREQIVDRYLTPVPSETSVLLVGKDGTLKSRSSDLNLEATFGLIDQMPMRREEMLRKSNEG